jgi:hypothetical protein
MSESQQQQTGARKKITAMEEKQRIVHLRSKYKVANYIIEVSVAMAMIQIFYI